MNNLFIIVTSAVTASLISGLFLLLNDHLRRKSDERRTKFESAIQLTALRHDHIKEIVKRTSKKVIWPAPINTFEKTFKMVSDIWDDKYKKPDKPPLEA